MEATDTVAFFIFMSMGKLRAFFSKKDQKKLEDGLANTKKSFFSRLGTIIVGKKKIDEIVTSPPRNRTTQQNRSSFTDC